MIKTMVSWTMMMMMIMMWCDDDDDDDDNDDDDEIFLCFRFYPKISSCKYEINQISKGQLSDP